MSEQHETEITDLVMVARATLKKLVKFRDNGQLADWPEITLLTAALKPFARSEMMIDHIDGDPSNNDPANLRLVTPPESFGTVTRKK